MIRHLLITALLCFLAAILTVLFLQSQPPAYSPGVRNYKIFRDGKETLPLRADRLSHRDGCIEFWRADRLDTLICGGLADVIVTEVYE